MKLLVIIQIIYLIFIEVNNCQQNEIDLEEPPEGYLAFVESPSAVPPRVRLPPYTNTNNECNHVMDKKSLVSVNNLCGDLNKGQIPKNPLQQNVLGESYPFELIRNETLKFLSKTLPVLKTDDTLPKVTQIVPTNSIEDSNNGINKRLARVKSFAEDNEKENRQSKNFCQGGGVFCTLFRVIQGGNSQQPIAERRQEHGPARYEGPPTPCPAKVEYATPVFAKNYQGSWRYVVQIPYEGYFTQTVEVTKCLQARCHYLDGGCLSSPRWVSLLVAEIFYPKSDEFIAKTSTTTPSIQDFQIYQSYLQKRAGVASSSDIYTSNDDNPTKQQHCDGTDEIGCFQVRLYYDWFLVPGSCKCWRPDYFAKYVRRKSSSADL